MKLLKAISGGILIAGVLYISSCSEFIEEDISDEMVTVLGPTDTVIDYSTITFWWQPVDGATFYRMQLVQPTFANPLNVVMDTVVTTTQFDYTPDVGLYEWRVRAENSAYQSLYTEPRPLDIKYSDDLSRIDIVLRKPANNLLTRDTVVRFSWDLIPIATSYELHLEGGEEPVDTLLTSNSFLYKLPRDEMTYYWKVKAGNATSFSLSDEYQFRIDRVSPLPPTLQTPKTDSVFALANPVKFVWTREAGVAVDSFRIEKKQTDDTWLLLTGFTPRKTTVPELTLSKDEFNSPSTSASYRWCVISIDQAGNKSQPAYRTFTIGSL